GLAAAAAGAGPEEDRAVALPKARAEVALDHPRAALRGADLGRHDLGPGPARGAQPEIDDRRALDDRIVAQDNDELDLRDHRERHPEGIECWAQVLGEERRVGAEPSAQE